ncbi:hypothetical protein HMPREF1872_01208 [Amygdalobacter nucleatus]|uniref:Uncharacterized protein n=1 Tax=Amygdalobacter nucleatus TaxID=3029274 RepID=A0A133Y7L4_9FIRM|nr:hypothetical protein HMPREF1872_01208 [Amygdalobacter nucleatus]
MIPQKLALALKRDKSCCKLFLPQSINKQAKLCLISSTCSRELAN